MNFSLSPTPQVEWIKIGYKLPMRAKLESHGKLLIVPSIEQEDSGKYMCKAKNKLGEVVHYFTVTVEGTSNEQRRRFELFIDMQFQNKVTAAS